MSAKIIIEAILDAEFVQPLRAKRAGDAVVEVDIAAFDRAFAKDDNYVGPGGSGGIAGRRERFREFLNTGKFDPRTKSYVKEPVEMPEVTVREDGAVYFINGRHRYSVFRDEGWTTLPMSMDATSAHRAILFRYAAR